MTETGYSKEIEDRYDSWDWECGYYRTDGGIKCRYPLMDFEAAAIWQRACRTIFGGGR